jgi:uncharacterized membrane protein YqhA
MHDPDPRAPLLPAPLLRACKVFFGILAAGIAAIGGVITFAVAAAELWHGATLLLGFADAAAASSRSAQLDDAIVAVVKSIDAVLLALVQFLLAAFLWQILDPNESLVDEENMERLEEAKQILCKVVLVIVAVRMLAMLVGHDGLRWESLVFPAGIVALSFGSSSLSRASKAESRGNGTTAG